MRKRARARALKRLPGLWKVWIVRIIVTGPRRLCRSGVLWSADAVEGVELDTYLLSLCMFREEPH